MSPVLTDESSARCTRAAPLGQHSDAHVTALPVTRITIYQEAHTILLEHYQVAITATTLRHGRRDLSIGSHGRFVRCNILVAGSCAPIVDITFEPDDLAAELRGQSPNRDVGQDQIANSPSESTQRDLKLSLGERDSVVRLRRPVAGLSYFSRRHETPPENKVENIDLADEITDPVTGQRRTFYKGQLYANSHPELPVFFGPQSGRQSFLRSRPRPGIPAR